MGTRAWRRVATGGIAERLACFSGTLMTYEFRVGASTMVQFILKEKGVWCGGGDGAESCEALCHCFSRFGDLPRGISDRTLTASAKCGVTELSQNCWMRKFRSDVWAFVVRKSGHGRLTDRGYPRRPDFAASWPTPTPLRAVKFGDGPCY